MVRTYIRKTTRGNWSTESLHLAIVAVHSGSCSLNQAASDFEIPEATLRRYVKKSPNEYPQNLGRYLPVFTEELENKLATYVVEMGKRYYGMTNWQMRKLALKRKSKAKSATLITGSPFKAQLMLVNSGGSLAKRQCKGKNAAANKPSSSSESK